MPDEHAGAPVTRTWSELFPEGRHVFYEGDDPDRFAKQMRDRFGFDPSTHPEWAERIYPEPGEPPFAPFTSYAFHCPAEHMDAVYGSDEWPIGS